MKKISYILFLLCVTVVYAQKPVQIFKNNPLLQNANLSVLVKDVATGEVIAELNSRNSVVPASTMKTVTTASALEILGNDYRFKTTLEIDGKIDSDGTLNGNLIICGGGDPTLGSEKTGDKDFLVKWADAVQKAGITKINGKVIASENHFDNQVVNPHWTWEDMANYYAPGIHSISYLDNMFRLVFNSGAVGTTPAIVRTEPAIAAFVFQNYVKSTTTKSDNAYFYGAPFSYARSIYGEIPASRPEFVVKGDLPHPAEFLVSDFYNALLLKGISITDAYNTNDLCEKKTIYTHLSPPLSEIINEINVHSNNHYAEYVFKELSAMNGEKGNNEASVEKIESFWKSKGLPVDELFQYDGSGLSPQNAVSANFFVEMLSYMKNKSAGFGYFYSSLPVAGENGTLKSILANTPLQGKVHAKSGTIARVKCYTGFIEIKKRTLVFAIMVNNANGASKEATAKIENLLLDISKQIK